MSGPAADIVERLHYSAEHGIFDAEQAGMGVSASEAATEIKALRRKLRVTEEKVAGAVSDLKRAARRLPGITMALSEQFDELDAALALIRGEQAI